MRESFNYCVCAATNDRSPAIPFSVAPFMMLIVPQARAAS